MLTLALVFLAMTIIAAIVGFSGIAITLSLTFQILFYICLGLFIISFIVGIASKPPKV